MMFKCLEVIFHIVLNYSSFTFVKVSSVQDVGVATGVSTLYCYCCNRMSSTVLHSPAYFRSISTAKWFNDFCETVNDPEIFCQQMSIVKYKLKFCNLVKQFISLIVCMNECVDCLHWLRIFTIFIGCCVEGVSQLSIMLLHLLRLRLSDIIGAEIY